MASSGDRRLRGWRRWALWAEVVFLALLGTWVGLTVGARYDAPIGPVRSEMRVTPSLTGDSVVRVPPLGRLVIDSHDGPLRLDAEVSRIDASDARRIFNDPSSVRGLPDVVERDVRRALLQLVWRAALAATGAAALLGLLVLRRWRRALATAAVALSVVVAGGATAYLTRDPDAVSSPRYDGLLAIAPTVIGDAQSIVSNFQRYEEQLARLVTNVARLYDVTSTLPAYSPSPDTVRVLHVSDLHLNPASWEILRSIADQFDIDVVVDTGDITDHGSSAESRFLDPIPTLGKPYVFVRGNHDSPGTERALDALPGTTVLRGDRVVTVAGLTFLGAPDPRFTPDKDTRGQEPPPSVEQVGASLAEVARTSPAPPALVLVHDPAAAAPLDGVVPLVLAGHGHRREVRYLPGGTRLFEQGSTGGAGLRGVEKEDPTPIQCSVLYLDRATGALQAWDDISLGGLGLSSAQIERHVAQPPPGSPPPSAAASGSAVASRMLWRSPTASAPWAVRPHRLAAQDAGLSSR